MSVAFKIVCGIHDLKLRGAFGIKANLNQVLSLLGVRSEGPLQPTHSSYEYLQGLNWLLPKGKLCRVDVLQFVSMVHVCVCVF